MSSLAVDVFSDVVCPWCLIGTTRLDQALATFPDLQATVVYHPFLLDPSTPTEGQDLRERLRAKYGADPERMFERVEHEARASGIPLDFSRVKRSINTVRAQTLLRLAQQRGTQRPLAKALFAAYFLEGQDVSDPEVLAALASSHGFTSDETRALVADEAELERTRQEAAAATEEGIQGVPFFVFDGRLAFSGAQPVETFRQVIARALEPREEDPQT